MLFCISPLQPCIGRLGMLISLAINFAAHNSHNAWRRYVRSPRPTHMLPARRLQELYFFQRAGQLN